MSKAFPIRSREPHRGALRGRAARLLFWLGLWSLAGLGQAPYVRAGDELPIYIYPCPHAAGPITLDGRLDEATWQEAALVSGFTIFGQERLAEVQTSFRVLWDERFLYLGVQCEEPEMARLTPVKFAHDEHGVFSSESIEFFVDPDHTHARYYQIAFNCAGSLFDGQGTETAWNSEAQAAVWLGADRWTAELAVPWASLGTQPRAGKIVGFNVCRNRYIGGRTWSQWARTIGGFHDPLRFAHLVLSATPEQIAQLAEELRRGDRKGPLVVFSAEGFAQTTYAQLAETAFAQTRRLLTQLADIQRQEKDPAAAAEIERRRAIFEKQIADLEPLRQGHLDAATWIKLDLTLQQLQAQMQQSIWEARLTALLNAL